MYQIFAIIICLFFAATAQAEHTFVIEKNEMLLDGKPFQMICGEMHFARIPVEYWRDRLRRAKAMGLNTIATYVFWNVEEPEPGQFHFTEEGDVAKFVRTAQEEGLYVFLRPGPYCCAEWDFGGYPYWLLKDRDMHIRSNDPHFIQASREYIDALAKQLVPLQITHGGPIILTQVENEYGSFGKDKAYMEANRDNLIHAGFDVPLCTADGPNKMALNGSVPGALPAINGEGFKATTQSVDAIHPGGPYMIGEFYPGWLDHWGEPFVHTAADHSAKAFADDLAHGMSVNIYVVHGGTNFGFMNGANSPPYLPSITSYDYDAPIGEAGNLTPKYFKLRAILLKYAPPGSVPDAPADNPTMAIAPVELTQAIAVTRTLPAPITSENPTAMEDLNQAYGYVLYRTTIAQAVSGELKIEHGVRDYAVIMVDGKVMGSIDRRLKTNPPVNLNLASGSTMDLLVENTGRINYGKGILDNRQGIIGAVSIGDQQLHGWQNFSLPMKGVASLTFGTDVSNVPAFHRGSFDLASTADTFLDMRGWGKGQVWVNGHNIGRFWRIGPQQTLYIPKPWLREGKNDLIVLELADTGKRAVAGLDHPILDQLTKPTTRPDVPHGG